MVRNSVAELAPLPGMVFLKGLAADIRSAKLRNPEITNKALASQVSEELFDLFTGNCVVRRPQK